MCSYLDTSASTSFLWLLLRIPVKHMDKSLILRVEWGVLPIFCTSKTIKYFNILIITKNTYLNIVFWVSWKIYTFLCFSAWIFNILVTHSAFLSTGVKALVATYSKYWFSSFCMLVMVFFSWEVTSADKRMFQWKFPTPSYLTKFFLSWWCTQSLCLSPWYCCKFFYFRKKIVITSLVAGLLFASHQQKLCLHFFLCCWWSIRDVWHDFWWNFKNLMSL